MRWQLIATGFLFSALLRFAFGHSEARPQLPAEAAVADPIVRPAPPPREKEAPTQGNGASILSLIEVGPAEIEPAAPPKAPVPSDRSTAQPLNEPVSRPGQDAEWRAQRRLDRQAFRAILFTLRDALDSCGKQQLVRNPRLLGEVRVDVTLVPRPGTERGMLKELEIEHPSIFIPIFDGCIRNAMGSAVFPRPATQVEIGTSYTLEHEEPAADDADTESDSADQAPADTAT